MVKQFSLSFPLLATTFKERSNIGLHLCHRAKFQACSCPLEVYFLALFVTNHREHELV